MVVVKMRLNAWKQRKKGKQLFTAQYDADTDEIRLLWLSNPSTLNCPILSACKECGRCFN
jgi:hypothetical protein